uniref:Uncharacterized protein n=1 Tax=viral metagenome TaxID=1070528 RepID=A0A6C0KNJ2_9ZZZZ
MSILFKFVGSSFLLTFGIILLVCGSIMLYSYRRINLLERSVIEHGKILQSFILNYNIQMQSINSLYSKNKFENEETKQIKKINLGDKIYVSEDDYSENEYIVNNNTNSHVSKANLSKANLSKANISKANDDDEDDEDDEDDKDEDEANDDDEDDEDDEDDKDEDEDEEDDEDEANDDDEDEDDDDEDEDDDKEANGEANEETKEEDSLEEASLEKLLILTKKEFEQNLKDLGDFEEIDLNKPYFSNSDDETFIKNLPVNLDTFNIDLNTNSKIINLNTIEIPDQETDVTSGLVDSGVTKKNYSKMKVDDLKTIAVTRNLIDNETAQKMKKADLIKIIQNA